MEALPIGIVLGRLAQPIGIFGWQHAGMRRPIHDVRRLDQMLLVCRRPTRGGGVSEIKRQFPADQGSVRQPGRAWGLSH